MSQGAYVTLVGFVAGDPILRKTKDGTTVTDVRVGATTRVLDRSTGEWRDSDTSYFTVNCWRRLGEHAKASLHKGDPVVVKGRFHTRSYEDKTGRLRTEVEIAADTVGHDLSRGIANYMRTRTPADAAGDQAAGAVQAVGSSEHVPASDIIDEEALQQFERELDAGLSEDELAAQARDQDDEDYGDDEHEAIGTPGTPRIPDASMPI
jgi:single-strand DNA-binding protein